MLEKILERGMLFRIMSTTRILQIFGKIILNSKVVIQSIIDPDDNSNLLSSNGLIGLYPEPINEPAAIGHRKRDIEDTRTK